MKTFKIITIILSFFVVMASIVSAQQPPANVSITKVFEKTVAKTNKINGIIDFDRKSKLSSELSGLIEKQFIKEGSIVGKGDVLASLSTDFIIKNIEIKQKEIELIEVEIKNAERDLERNKTLLKTYAISIKKYEDIEQERNMLIKKKEIAFKNIEKLELEMSKSNVRAPFNGIILEKYIDKGVWVSPGVPICLLASISDVCAAVAISEELLNYVKIGDDISIVVNALQYKTTGKIKKIIPVADLASKTFQIKISIPYFQKAIQNMSVYADIPVSENMKLKMIKRDALVLYNGKNFVYTVKDGKAKILPINIVAYEKDYIAVDNKYITVGMSIITGGSERLRPDQAVKVVKSK
jgi:membrane fusion protein, multidrug efflux system